MTLQELEQHIKDAGSLMATALVQYEQSGCLLDRGEADAWRLHMEAAMAERDGKRGD